MPHYYDEVNVPLNPYLIKVRFDGVDYEFYSGSGIFSRDKLDRGSEVLIKNSIVGVGQSVLDLGCGNGIVGMLTYIKYGCVPTFSDISNNAITCTRLNIKKFGKEFDVIKSDIYDKLKKFDVILTNPPYVAGRDICKNFVIDSKTHLNKNGSLQLVCKYNKGGKFFEELMRQTFGNVSVLAKKSGYRVFMSKND